MQFNEERIVLSIDDTAYMYTCKTINVNTGITPYAKKSRL